MLVRAGGKERCIIARFDSSRQLVCKSSKTDVKLLRDGCQDSLGSILYL